MRLWPTSWRWRIVLGMVLTATIAIATLAIWLWQSYQLIHEPFPASGSPSTVTVEIEPGLSAGAILDRLESVDVVADARLARLYLIHLLEDPPLQAGQYRFERPATTPQILDQLIQGKILLHPVTVLEGSTMEETADQIVASGFSERAALLAAMANPSPIRDLDPQAENLEGYLFPDTYSFAEGATAEQIVTKMVSTFRQRFEQRLQPLLDEPTRLRQVVTLASIVEKEATLDRERPQIAGVYANRIRIGMGLYADPTVIFALKLAGRWDGNIRRRDLEIDSPYNTYRYPGLPPGPICSPGLESLLAAAQPESVPYLYFVSRNDGSHVFAETLSEHNRNVERWQRQYWRDRRREQREAAAESGSP